MTSLPGVSAWVYDVNSTHSRDNNHQEMDRSSLQPLRRCRGTMSDHEKRVLCEEDNI